MGVERQGNFLGGMRIDSPILRGMESAEAFDFDVLAGLMLAGGNPNILKGFNLSTTNLIGAPASSLVLNTAGGLIINYQFSESGSIFEVPLDRVAETLNASNPRVSGGFSANNINFISIDTRRTADPTTADTVPFIDDTTGKEVAKTVPLARTLDYKIIISTNDFATMPHVAPAVIVVTDANNNVLSLTDARSLMFRLATGGGNPQIHNTYNWPHGRSENKTGDVFAGGDKVIGSVKEWMDALMTSVWETKGGEFWYSPTSDRYNRLTRGPSVFANGEQFEWTGTHLHWKNLRFVFGNGAGAYYNDINDQTSNSTGLTDLAEGECVYVDVDFTANRTGGTALSMLKAPMTALGAPITPGTRYVVAWRTNNIIFTRDGQFAVGTTFTLATNSSTGVVQLLTNPNGSWPSSSTPIVPIVNNNSATTGLYRNVIAAGVSRGDAESGLSGGTLNVGSGLYDTSIIIGSTNITGSVSINSNTHPINLTTGSGFANGLVAGSTAATLASIQSTTGVYDVTTATGILLGANATSGVVIGSTSGAGSTDIRSVGGLKADKITSLTAATTLLVTGSQPIGATAEDFIFKTGSNRSTEQTIWTLQNGGGTPLASFMSTGRLTLKAGQGLGLLSAGALSVGTDANTTALSIGNLNSTMALLALVGAIETNQAPASGVKSLLITTAQTLNADDVMLDVENHAVSKLTVYGNGDTETAANFKYKTSQVFRHSRLGPTMSIYNTTSPAGGGAGVPVGRNVAGEPYAAYSGGDQSTQLFASFSVPFGGKFYAGGFYGVHLIVTGSAKIVYSITVFDYDGSLVVGGSVSSGLLTVGAGNVTSSTAIGADFPGPTTGQSVVMEIYIQSNGAATDVSLVSAFLPYSFTTAQPNS